MSDLVKNLEDRIYHEEAQSYLFLERIIYKGENFDVARFKTGFDTCSSHIKISKQNLDFLY